jgi:anti-sigma B factor antagonist
MEPDDVAFRIEIADDPAGPVVIPHGELDLATQGELRAVLEEHAAHGGMTLDLAALRFMDTSGLRLVLETAEAARREGFAFTVLPGRESVQRLFEIAGVTDLVPFAPRGNGAT